MSGVSGNGVSMGGASGPTDVDLDFRAIYEGGENFMARAKALSQLRAQQAETYAQLRLGSDAAAALADAQRQRDEAAASKDAAAKEIADAKQAAADAIARANEEGMAVVRNAQSIAATLTDEAKKVKAEADAYAAKVRADADTAMTNAASAVSSAQERESKAQEVLDDLAAKQKTLDESQVSCNALAASLQSKIDALHAAIEAVKA